MFSTGMELSIETALEEVRRDNVGEKWIHSSIEKKIYTMLCSQFRCGGKQQYVPGKKLSIFFMMFENQFP